MSEIICLQQLRRNLRYGARRLARTPCLTIVAILTLSLGIGVCSAAFAIVYAVLIRPIPYFQPNQLFNLTEFQGNEEAPLSYREFIEVKSHHDVLQGAAAYFQQEYTLHLSGHFIRVNALRMSSGAVDLLGIHLYRGPGFSTNAERPGSAPQVIISRSLWDSAFGRSPGIIGSTIQMGVVHYRVVGIISKAPLFARDSDVIVPLQLTEAIAPASLHFLQVIVRKRHNVDTRTVIAVLNRSLTHDSSIHYAVQRLQSVLNQGTRMPLTIIGLAASLLMLISLANTGLVIGFRARSRQREAALKVAFGASWSCFIVESASEALVLGLTSGIIGMFLSWIGVRASAIHLRSIMTSTTLLATEIAVPIISFILILAASAVFALVASLASHPRRLNIFHSMSRSVGVSRRVKLVQNGFVVLVVVFAMVLLTGSALLVRSFIDLTHVKKGFIADDVITAQINPSARWVSTGRMPEFFRELTEAMKSIPGASSAGIVSAIPIEGGSASGDVTSQQPGLNGGRTFNADKILVAGEYFKTMSIPILRGRSFDINDNSASPNVAIINTALAREMCGKLNCVGRLVNFGWGGHTWSEIVGVVGSTRQDGLDQAPSPAIYVPFLQCPKLSGEVGVHIVMKIHATAPLAGREIADELHRVDSDEPAPVVSEMTHVVSEDIAARKSLMLLLLVLAGIAVVLAGTGILGAFGYSAIVRQSEFALRIAMGATRYKIGFLVIANAATVIAIGLLVGGGLAMGGAFILRSLLYGVTPLDPVSLAISAGFIIVIAIAACAYPVVYASNSEPALVLKSE